jgi:ABC-type tungstate transport system substrate-binding protein
MNPANPLGDRGKVLVFAGIAIAAVGVLLLVGGRLPFRLGRLPGDISYQGRSGSFYFPVVTCIVLSVALTLIMWIINYFRR